MRFKIRFPVGAKQFGFQFSKVRLISSYSFSALLAKPPSLAGANVAYRQLRFLHGLAPGVFISHLGTNDRQFLVWETNLEFDKS